ncbi:hypothetical protein FA15DRAFT_730111 [Coprinopsis marcescibilis]|uniref:Uncharacterized protein n=1 Tax=Coprinopsis marcescibilis TaxID=230819 RepID=A0A5C3KET1_COPMA|nr:hypothetical protein FA15DRAFT_730111 [Coprinopsis marcescibilis]
MMIWRWKRQRSAFVALSISYATTKSQFTNSEPSSTSSGSGLTTTLDSTSEEFVFITSLTELALLSDPPRPSRSASSSPSQPIPASTPPPPPPLTDGDTDSPSSAPSLPPQVPNAFNFFTTIVRSPNGTTTSIIIILDTATPNNGRPSSKPLPVGPIVGSSIAALVLLQILILVFFFAWRRRKRGSASASALALFPLLPPPASEDGGFVGLARVLGVRRRSIFKDSSGRSSDYAGPCPALPIRKEYTQRTGDPENEAMTSAPAQEGNTVPNKFPANSGIGSTPRSTGHPDGAEEDGNEEVITSLPEMQERIRSLQQQLGVALLRARESRPASVSTSAEEPPPMYSSSLGSPVV